MIFWKEGARGARGTDQGRNQGTGIRATGTRNPLARETDGGGRETWRAAGAISQRAGMRPREMAEHLAPFCFLSAWLPRTATRTRGLCWAFAGRRGRGAIGCGDQGGVQFLPRFLWWWWWRRWSASCLKSRELGSCPCVPITKSSSPRPLALPNGRFQHTTRSLAWDGREAKYRNSIVALPGTVAAAFLDRMGQPAPTPCPSALWVSLLLGTKPTRTTRRHPDICSPLLPGTSPLMTRYPTIAPLNPNPTMCAALA